MNEELIRAEILQGLLQVDSSFSITDFFTNYDRESRKLSVSFTAETGSGEVVEVVKDYA